MTRLYVERVSLLLICLLLALISNSSCTTNQLKNNVVPQSSSLSFVGGQQQQLQDHRLMVEKNRLAIGQQTRSATKTLSTSINEEQSNHVHRQFNAALALGQIEVPVTKTNTTTAALKSNSNNKKKKTKRQETQSISAASNFLNVKQETPSKIRIIENISHDHNNKRQKTYLNFNNETIIKTANTATIVQPTTITKNTQQNLPPITTISAQSQSQSPPIWINLGLANEIIDSARLKAPAELSSIRTNRPQRSSSPVAPNTDQNMAKTSTPNDHVEFANKANARGDNETLSPDSSVSCQQLIGLTKGQAQLCNLYKDHMPFVSLGARLTIDECQWQLRHERWNCSVHDPVSVFGPIIKMGVKETALVNALASASVVYTIAGACREGRLTNCGCAQTARPKNLNAAWKWNGCMDNLDYAYRFAEEFVDLRERELLEPTKYKMRRHITDNSTAVTMMASPSKSFASPSSFKLDKKRLMNIHNNQAGRRAVVRKSKVVCKCHGVSGVCSMITCWQQLSSFRDIGDALRARYDSAAEVKFSQQDGRLQVRNKRYTGLSSSSSLTAAGKITPDDLIYVEQSPDYCRRIDRIDFNGTRGRVCLDSYNCRKLCCGRGYNQVRRVISYRCNCRQVGGLDQQPQCQVCQSTQVQNICN
ncbi:Protein Wnt-5b [Fragariocoptes setiger]|uniref:Protein Wnt n=1 Tax=Fragariocoptes setiger TaxID=1670756 RepID=A0ABQ7SCW0_9ACAR|nr:Protein Wnt-5b [Fragariocoptes setiger]